MKERSLSLILVLGSTVYLVASAIWEQTAQSGDENISIRELKPHYTSVSQKKSEKII